MTKLATILLKKEFFSPSPSSYNPISSLVIDTKDLIMIHATITSIKKNKKINNKLNNVFVSILATKNENTKIGTITAAL